MAAPLDPVAPILEKNNVSPLVLIGGAMGVAAMAGAGAGAATAEGSASAAGGLSEVATADMLGLSTASDVAAVGESVGLSGAAAPSSLGGLADVAGSTEYGIVSRGGVGSGSTSATSAPTASVESASLGITDVLSGASSVRTMLGAVGGMAGADAASGPVDEVSPERSSGPSTANRERAFETRKQMVGRAAAAAGARRSGNDADVLGATGRTTARRRVGVVRTLLGY